MAFQETQPAQRRKHCIRSASVFFCCLIIGVAVAHAQSQLSSAPDGQTLTIDDAPEMQVIAFSKTVVIKKHAKEVFVWGGDIIVEGRVDGDVATIGGSIIQKEGGYIGGDVIVFGGQYRPESRNPLRTEGKQTVMFGMFEEELRDVAQNPSQLLSPSFTFAFAAQRILSALFWFIVTLGVVTIAPGAVSRAIARFRLSALKIAAIGVAGFLITCIGVVAGLSFLPDYVSAVVGLMAFALLMLAYGFGRVALHVSVGKFIQKTVFAGDNRSETIAILIGVLTWTLLLSIPYVWTIALFALFSVGIGLVVTARSQDGWKTS